MNEKDLNHYTDLLAERGRLIEFLRWPPQDCGLSLRACLMGQHEAGYLPVIGKTHEVTVRDQAVAATTLAFMRQQAREQISRNEAELAAAGIEFEPASIPAEPPP